MEDLRVKIHRYFIEKTDFLAIKDKMSEPELRAYVAKAIDNICFDSKIKLTEDERAGFIREIVGSVVSYGPIRPLMEDNSITEIMINGAKEVYIQRNGRLELTDVKFDHTQHLTHTIQKILAASGTSRRVDESLPYVDFSMNDGARVNVILPPVSMKGPVITIRKFATDINTVDDLVKKGMLNQQMAMLLISAIKAKLNIVFCGATGTGKTTALNVLSKHIPEDERIITIEDTAELRLSQKHVVSLQSKGINVEGKGAISIRELFINSLRMRPDRIILGEIRGQEALDMVQSISSGHTGSLSILHADSPQDCFDRLVTSIMMTGIRLTNEEIKRQVARAIDLIVHIELFVDGNRRITNVTDVRYDVEKDKIHLDNIFEYGEQKVLGDAKVVGEWKMNKKMPSFYKKFEKRHIEIPEGFFE